MASAQVTKLLVDLEARTARFEQGMNKAQKSLRRTEAQTAKLRKGMALAGKAFATFGGALGARALIQGARNLANLASEVVHTSDVIGFGVEQLQAYRAAGEDLGIAAQTTDMALQRFSRRLGEAQTTGKGELLPVLRSLNIEISNIDGTARDANEVLFDFADALAETDNKSEKLALAFKAFDSEGAKFLAVLDEGGPAMRDLADNMRESGRIIEEDYARALEKASTDTGAFFDSITVGAANALGAFVSIFQQDEIKQLSDEVNDLAQRMSQFPQAEEWLRPELDRRLERLKELLDPVRDAVESINNGGTTGQKARRSTGILDVSNFNAPDLEQFDVLKKITAQSDKYVDTLYERADATQALINAQDGLTASAEDFGATLKSAGEGAVNDFSATLSQALLTGEADFGRFIASVASDLTSLAIRQGISKILGGFADGAAFDGGRVIPFANGGVVTGPTIFPMANGAGLMGEAGPEAVLPLKRTRSGKLGVIAQGGGGNNITVNVVNNAANTPQNDGRLGRTVAEEIRKQVNQVARSTLVDERRVGGVLNPV